MSFPAADRSENLMVWVVLWSALLAWQVLTARRADLPSVVVIVRLLRRWWVPRWSLLLAWGWLGWHLFVRTTF